MIVMFAFGCSIGALRLELVHVAARVLNASLDFRMSFNRSVRCWNPCCIERSENAEPNRKK